jgi:hypothetical protein
MNHKKVDRKTITAPDICRGAIMEWEAKKLVVEFLHKINLSELHLDSTRKKLRQDPSSGIDKMLFDKQLGEWMVYKEFENSDSLSSRTRLLNDLDYMLQRKARGSGLEI